MTPRFGARYEAGGLAAIAQRDLTKLLRDRLRLAVSLAFPVLLIGGLGNALQSTVGKATGLDAVTLAFTGVLAATLFQSAAAGMISLVEDRETDFSRELFVTPVSRLTLVGGKVVGETLVSLFQGLLVVVFAVIFGVSVSLRQAVLLAGPAVGCCLLGAAFGLATLSALPNQRAAMQFFQFLLIPQYVLAGVIVPISGLAGWLRVVAWAMPMSYGVELTRAGYYSGSGGYSKVVSAGPVVDVAVMAALFVGLLVGGAALLEYRERNL